jgi:hypothetical protein
MKEIRHGIPLATYRAWDGYGSSDLKAFRQGPPALCKWKREHPEPSSDAMRVGTAAHCAILEPSAFEQRYWRKPEGCSFATKDGKALKASVPEGAIILTFDECQQVDQIVAAFRGKPQAAESLARAMGIEASLRWNDIDTGLPLKARPDWFEDGWVVDLKISRWASEQSLSFRAFTEGWSHQLALYRAGLVENGVDIKGGRLVVIHPEPPQSFRVFCVELKDNWLDLMHLENERTIRAMAECHESGYWPGAPSEWFKIDMPPLALNESARMDWEEDQEIVHGN